MDKNSIIKHIIQYLNDKGLNDVSLALESESQVFLESKEIKLVKQLIPEDKIDEAVNILSNNKENGDLIESFNIKNLNNEVRFLIKTKLILYKIFQLILNNEINVALPLIRENIQSIQKQNKMENKILLEASNQFKKCSQLIFSKNISKSEFKNKMNEICPSASSKENLIEYINNIVLMKESNIGYLKLENIFDEVMKKEIKFCKYHNKNENEFSYFFEHNCKKKLIPYKKSHSIEIYNEEILNVVYSNSFKYFAVVLKGNNIAIYRINNYTIKEKNLSLSDVTSNSFIDITLINTIESSHKSQITALQWNSTDKLILTASKDKLIKLFDPFTGKCKSTLEGHGEMVSSAIFVLNDSKILSSGLDYKISLWSLQGACEYFVSVPTVTISELLFSPILNMVIVISATTNSIIYYNINTKEEIDKMPMNDAIVSCAVSKLDNGGYLLVNSSKATPVLNLINLYKYTQIERKFFGHRQERFNNKCNFGGVEERFLLCGSEDGKIYIWIRNHSIPIYSIKVHSGPVNAVIWANSILTDVIISCSEDHTIKVLVSDNVDKVNVFYSDKENNKKKPLEHKIINLEDRRVSTSENDMEGDNNSSTSVSLMLYRMRNYFRTSFSEERNSDDEEEI